MPHAPVGDGGIQLYYEDTGAPPNSSDYTTLVLVHGGVFNGSTFKPMFVHAADCNMRLVALNTRDYRGSTPYSSSDLEALRSTNLDEQRAMIDARGQEVAAFLVWFIRQANIPLRSKNQEITSSGGLALLGWSWGNTMTVSFLAQASRLPQEDRRFIDDYLSAFIMYDSARHGLGVPPEITEGLRRPARGRDETVDQNNVFQHWLSGYYVHSPPILDSFPSVTLDDLQGGLVHLPITSPSSDYEPSTTRMTHQEFADVTDPDVVKRAHPLYHAVNPVLYKENIQGALWNATTWPHLKVTLVWCDMSPPETVLSAWYLANQVGTNWPRGARKVDVLRFQGANHFPHWDQPKRTIKLLSSII
ncbi:Alpha/Beta hydrolase protein [Fomitopsis serialis]|uniref:Alpha/Beta hydrolase protein n=1 Tax=Fomitopsis serialis TaxID=139415 RepID=UPI0020072DF8|nr:Alpha/Beta hydrolase protein [Neoantrodia serialis]KAH9937693.1 Alpha/Beta hydrolase protein [Neoantrodia serialis]